MKRSKNKFLYDYFTRSREWKEVREIALTKYGRKCMRCFSKKTVQVDHILSRKMHPELALTVSNLQVLCGPCNTDKGYASSRDYRPVGVEIDTTRSKAVEFILRKATP